MGEIISYLKRPKLAAFIPEGEPAIQSIGLTRRAFYHVGVRNIGGRTVKNARVYLGFKGTGKELRITAKWDFKAEPLDSYLGNPKPIPWLIVDSQVHDLLPAVNETFAVIMKYQGENEVYPFSTLSYLYPNLKETQNILDTGRYTVRAILVSENYRGSFAFEMINARAKRALTL